MHKTQGTSQSVFSTQQFTDRLNHGKRDNGEIKMGGHKKYTALRNRIYKVPTGGVSLVLELTSYVAPTLTRYSPAAWNVSNERCTEFSDALTRSMTKLKS